MSLPRNYRFSVQFSDAFPEGALAVSEIEPGTERQSQEDRARGRVPRQRTDAVTGLPVWQLTVTDPAAQRRGESAITVEILAAERPELPEPVAGMSMAVREVEFVGLTAEPRVGGQGEFRYLTYVYRAEGVRARGASGGSGAPRGASGRTTGSAGGSSSGSAESR